MIKIIYNLTELSELDINSDNYTTLFDDINSRLEGSLNTLFNLNFSIQLEKNLTEGDLVYEFRPFKNIRYSGKANIISNLLPGELVDFSTDKLGYDINHPVEIEIQPSYDGTVNLILNDDFNPPRMINSRFSVTEGKRFIIVDREGNKDTNLYDDDKIDNQTKLYKTINKIPKLDLLGLDLDGSMKVGNYVFYFRLVDADGNETDIITESGIVSCHIGNINDPKSIRGGLANENSGKSIKFRMTNIDSNYNFLNVYYSRSSGSFEEIEFTTYFKIESKFSVSSTLLEFKITGYEPVTQIDESRINLQYNIIDSCKSQAQTQNMLFLANIHKVSIPYRELKDLSLRILPIPGQESKFNIGFLDSNYIPSSDGKVEYYDAKNVYYYTGYWDNEMYRLGIVFIMNDYSLSNPFNIRGRDFSNVQDFSFENPFTVYTPKNLYNNKGERQFIEETDDHFVVGSNNLLENTFGVIKVGGAYLKSQIGYTNGAQDVPICMRFHIPSDVEEELKKYTKGFFFVRQKRIPTTLCQGISIAHDKASGLPLIPENWKTSGGSFQKSHTIQGVHRYRYGYKDYTAGYSQSLVTSLQDTSLYRLPLKNESYFSFVNENIISSLDINNKIKYLNKGGAFIVPDAILNAKYVGELFTGSEFNLTKTKFYPVDNCFIRNISQTTFSDNAGVSNADSNATHFTIGNYMNKIVLDNTIYKAKLILIPEDVALVNSDNIYYSSRAGIPEEAWRFSAFLKEEDQIINNGINQESNVLIRGIFSSYVGAIGNIYESGEFYNIHTLGYNLANISDYFKLRYSDNSPFYSISDRYEWERFDSEMNSNEVLDSINNYKYLTSFRGDCFINQVSIRILRNFQDPETPINDKVIDPITLNNFGGYKDDNTGVFELVKDNLDKINRGDVNAVRLGYWVTFKFCSNINYAFRAIDPTYSSEYALTGKPRAFFPLYNRSIDGPSKIADSTMMNVGYNSTTSDKRYFVIPDIPAIKNDFSNRIMYSETHINDAFKNGYRIFEGINYRDFTNDNGSITKIISWYGNLIVIFEGAVGVIPIKERTLAGQSEGGEVYLRNAGVLPEKPQILSHGYGSTWIDSIQASQNYIYGVDTVAKKIWRTDGKTFEVISDFKIQKFLNDNISFTIFDKTPLIGIRDVKTHVNFFKQDIMFTFYDETFNESDRVWNLCYNEQMNNWTTKYTWIPSFSENISNVYFSFNRDTCKVTSKIAKSLDSASGIGNIYIRSDREKPLEIGDYLSLFYERKFESILPSPSFYNQSIIAYIPGGTNTYTYSVPSTDNVFQFLSNTLNSRHPMYSDAFNSGFDKTWIFTPESGSVIFAYDEFNNLISIADLAKLYFYKSNGSEDVLITSRLNNDYLGDIMTDSQYPILKVRFVVDPILDLTQVQIDSLSRSGWIFKITSLPITESVLTTTEYYLSLQGADKYKNATFVYTLGSDPASIYDNNYFTVTNDTIDKVNYFSINPTALSSFNAQDKVNKIVELLSNVYLSILFKLNVQFAESLGNLQGSDQFSDTIYVRPNLDTLLKLQTMFLSLDTCPPIKPGVNLNDNQRIQIKTAIDQLIIEYTSSISTYLYKHGQAGIFESQETFKPAYWYGKQHPFEFEFIVNGSEVGIHKIFDNLKIISNRVQPESFEYEIVGDVYEFTKFDDKVTDLSTLDSISGGQLLPNITLINGRQTLYNKTNEYRILSIQESKNIDNVGIRTGNLRYKEDMWEVQISPIKYRKGTGPIKEAKIRDKYCKIRVKYKGNQLAVITALQTLYTLSYA